jgi:hypothetical protein
LTTRHLQGTISRMAHPWSDLRDKMPAERQAEISIEVQKELRKIEVSSTPLRKIDPAAVAEALGAELVGSSDKPVDVATSREILHRIAKR